MWETRVQSLGQEDPLEKEITIHSSTIAWKIPWMEEPGRLQSMGSQRVGHDWATSLSLSAEIRRRQWHPTPVLLPGKSHGWRSLVGCSPWGRKESDMTERLHFHLSLSCIGEGNGNPLQCSFLENPRDGGAWLGDVYGVAQSRTRLKWCSSSSSSCWDNPFMSIWVDTDIFTFSETYFFPPPHQFSHHILPSSSPSSQAIGYSPWCSINSYLWPFVLSSKMNKRQYLQFCPLAGFPFTT